MTKTENETALVGDSLAGGSDVGVDPRQDWRAFFDAHYRFVYAIARRMGGTQVDTDDLVQEVFIVAHRRLAEFEQRSSVRTWLYGICYNLLRRQRRSARRRAALAAAFGWITPTRSQATPSAEVNDELRKVERVLTKMKEHERDVFVLREIEGLGAEAIAEILGIPGATVRTRHHSARQSFLALWEKEGGAT